MDNNKKSCPGKSEQAPDSKHSSDMLGSPETVKTNPLTTGPLPDANVGAGGHCVFTAHAEDARPDTGGPCMDGRDGK